MALVDGRLESTKSNLKERWKLHSKDNNDPKEIEKVDSDMPVIVRGFDEDEISDEAWENIETGEPPKWIIMKEVSVLVTRDAT
jgi:hypothetical protein